MQVVGITALTLLFSFVDPVPCAAQASAPIAATGNAIDRGTLYRRAMARATDRAQGALMESMVVWEDHSTWEDPWRVQTPHYEVVVAGSRLTALELAHGLETMLGHFQDITGFEHQPASRFQIHVYPDIAGYNSFGNAVGAEHSSFYGSFYAAAHAERPVATFATASTGRQLMWVTHGATHQFLADASATPTPAWIEEGLASYFSLYWGYAWGVAELRLLDVSGGFIPLDQLLTDNIADFGDRPDARLLELGMLFNYLTLFRADTATVYDEDGTVTSAPFLDYLRGRLRGRDMTAHPVHALLTTGRSTLERDFRAFSSWE